MTYAADGMVVVCLCFWTGESRAAMTVTRQRGQSQAYVEGCPGEMKQRWGAMGKNRSQERPRS
jgi:hypothetical protein